MKVLLAEDDAIVRKAVAAGLRADGYDVELAEDGENALSLAQHTHPDLIVSDVLMPNMDGFSLCEAVRADDELHDVPVVFYSSTFLAPEDEALAHQVGASGFILKGEDVTVFREKLRNLIESEKQSPTLPLDSNSANRGEANRLHYKALVSKLHEKVTELGGERHALQENKQFLDRIVTTIPDVVFVMSTPEMRISYIAPNAERLLGYPGKMFIGDNSKWQTLIVSEDREKVVSELSLAMEKKRNVIITCRMLHQSGDARWIEGRITPHLDNAGEVVDMIGVMTDVTDRFKAEEDIRNLARFTEENPNPVLRVNTGGEILYANPASKALFGDCYAHGASECRILIEEAMQSLMDDKSTRVVYPIGQRHISFVMAPIKESGYVNIYGRDVTKRVQASQQLERTNHVLRTLSLGNRAMIHAATEDDLLQRVCDVLADEGGYPFVWTAYAENGEQLQVKVQCGNYAEQMQTWIDDVHHVSLFNEYFSTLLNDNQPMLADPLLSEVWTTKQIDSVRDGILSALVLLPLKYRHGLFGVIGIFSTRTDSFDETELSLLYEMASDVSYGIQAHRTQDAHEKSMRRIQESMFQTVEVVSRTLEKRDPYTAGHQQRVMQLAVAIARDMGFAEQRIKGLRLAAQVHDIGKIHVPAEILNRPGKLTASEFGIIRSHPQVGYDILKDVAFDWPIADIVLQHHERCDGSGYPQGLKHDEIIPEARIMAVADVVEAITSHRPYRPGLGIDIALGELEKGRGKIYSEDVVDTCLKLFREQGFSWEHNP